MRSHQRTFFFVLLTLLLGSAVGLFLTSDWVPKRRRPVDPNAIDQQPLQTARSLAALVMIRPEREFAEEALRIADHEVDVTFAAALRNAATSSAPTAQTKPLFDRVQQAQDRVAAADAELARLNKALASASPDKRFDLQQQVAVAQAQKELDADELDDAREDLARAGGDAHSRIQRLLDEHNGQHGNDPLPPQNSQPTASNLSAQLGLLNQLWSEQNELAQARRQAEQKAAALSQQHNRLEQQFAAAPAQQSVRAGAEASVATLKLISSNQKDLADLDKRIQDEQQLRDIYGRWQDLVQRRTRATVHRILVALFLILLILMGVFVGDRIAERSLTRMNVERRRLHTLRTVSRLAGQTFGLALILLVVFGPPNQLSTFIGLLSAALAVILKDFIVAFLGWFVLMGKNGIRVGDWVEIEGVRGEVLEIGVLRTVLLETGNWAEAGHPTGRKVAFVNSFAIEGHYFNFSTAGQWLWDELQVVVPLDDAYAMAEKIQKIASDMTSENERLATEEWGRVQRHGSEVAPAAPMSLRPLPSGVEVTVRFVTRAYERHQLRTRMYHAITAMMRHQPNAPTALAQRAPE